MKMAYVLTEDALLFFSVFAYVLRHLLFDGRLVVVWHAQQILDIGLFCSVSRTCRSDGKCIPDHLHGSFLVLCHFVSGLYVFPQL